MTGTGANRVCQNRKDKLTWPNAMLTIPQKSYLTATTAFIAPPKARGFTARIDLRKVAPGGRASHTFKDVPWVSGPGAQLECDQATMRGANAPKTISLRPPIAMRLYLSDAAGRYWDEFVVEYGSKVHCLY